MAWKEASSATFAGASGQMAVIAELLHRKCNAAIPHIDVGMDVFAFRDDREDVARIQVKTAPGKRYKDGQGFSARFCVPMVQLSRTDQPPLFYALAVRLDHGWASFVVISRSRLKQLWDDGCGSENQKSGDLDLHVQFRLGQQAGGQSELQARCGKFDLTAFLNDWQSLPPLKRLEETDRSLPHA